MSGQHDYSHTDEEEDWSTKGGGTHHHDAQAERKQSKMETAEDGEDLGDVEEKDIKHR